MKPTLFLHPDAMITLDPQPQPQLRHENETE